MTSSITPSNSTSPIPPRRYLRIHPSHIAISRQIANLTGNPLLPSWQIPHIIPSSERAASSAKFQLAERLNAMHGPLKMGAEASISQYNGIFTKYLQEERPSDSQTQNDAPSHTRYVPPVELSLASLRHSNFIVYGVAFSMRRFVLPYAGLVSLQLVLLILHTVLMMWQHWDTEAFPVGRLVMMVLLMAFECVLSAVGFISLVRRSLNLLTLVFVLEVSLLLLQLLQVENVMQIAYLVSKVGVALVLWVAREKLMMSWFTTSTLAD